MKLKILGFVASSFVKRSPYPQLYASTVRLGEKKEHSNINGAV